MVSIIAFVTLGLLANALILIASRTDYPQFTEVCTRCGYGLPPLEGPVALHDCPGCLWLDKET
ncbi:MAG: hypothetical protein JO235_08735 [Chroococcidiopsidaceae cyanobacterium CP_BM_RX_35]|nr:hypothetical protein [Chroococcidiopsidaceae cyanobacterium CP_BM_RX_35]